MKTHTYKDNTTLENKKGVFDAPKVQNIYFCYELFNILRKSVFLQRFLPQLKVRFIRF